ncbi:hypothetical protein EV138_3614 [Kribbella voronezhensis]|uniref:ATP-grasp domain-containing protein n=1 Tax=Kribbella voronezhensis TaxID=2512212 RepID=A0A4R7TD28_9ACTN|nr:hypothetical protein [Kribbella voronezhensis]TDU90032.1 hypothetical protein EV138_3614 [Kribbella voronezhensis]
MRAKILYVTDLSYPAKGRRYGDEDVYLTGRLREHFDLALCHPLDAAALMDAFDAVVVRNSGPVIHYQTGYDEFRAAAIDRGTRVFTQLTGKADMIGKQYLVDLSEAGYPVIPTTDSTPDSLPEATSYVVKPKLGSDSIGLRKVSRDELTHLSLDGLLAQPLIDFRYEVSFYFIDHDFQYALYVPDPAQRWELERYEPTDADRAFAQRFVDWNTIDHGIQRVDACRTATGELLLVELEDLNPFLSLELTDDTTRTRFVQRMAQSLTDLLAL